MDASSFLGGGGSGGGGGDSPRSSTSTNISFGGGGVEMWGLLAVGLLIVLTLALALKR